jgi:ATP-binding cassette subfamily B protein
MSVYLQEVLGISGMLLVKAFAKERAERERFRSLNRELRRLEIRQEMISNWYGVLLTGLTAAGPRSCGCTAAIAFCTASRRWARWSH